jgi:hypothetical protein
VTELRRRENPLFELPPELRGMLPGDLDKRTAAKAKADASASATKKPEAAVTA